MVFCEEHKLVSLWDMLIFAADRFVKAREELARIEQLVEIADKHLAKDSQEYTALPVTGMGNVWQDNLVQLHKQLCELNLLVSAKAATELIKAEFVGKPMNSSLPRPQPNCMRLKTHGETPRCTSSLRTRRSKLETCSLR
jgi:hypothetical protein